MEESRKLIDEFGNVHYLGTELARGGQGVVYRTRDPDLAIKQPLVSGTGKVDTNLDLKKIFCRVRTLSLPKGIPISMPLALLRDEPGYVMKLLNGMVPFEEFFLAGDRRNKEFPADGLPQWVRGIPNLKFRQDLAHYAQTGSTRRRLYALYKCAAILARLHGAGIVYGDLSLKNVFIGTGIPGECWLIDADNMRPEFLSGGRTAFTRPLGAPEIVQEKDSARPRTDCWAFSVMAFQLLTLCHPFKGKKVLNPENGCGWDAESQAAVAPQDLDEQADAGYLPFIDDEDDDSNELPGGGLPRMLVLTDGLRRLFQETLGVGRTCPHRRPAMMFWARELARACDDSLICPCCGMSYFSAPEFERCPYCQSDQPTYLVAKTDRWRMNIQGPVKEKFTVQLPRRLFHPFSLVDSDVGEYEAEVDLAKKVVCQVRGTRMFPKWLSLEFANKGHSGLREQEVVK